MKTKIIISAIILVIILHSVDSKAWDTTAAKFYPLSVGNVYIFDKNDLWFNCLTHETQETYSVQITNSVLKPNGKIYYQFSGWWDLYLSSPSWNYQRIDSGSMNVYAYDSVTNGEFLLDSLSGNVNDNFNCERLITSDTFGWFERTNQISIFNSQRTQRQFQCRGPIIAGTYYYLLEGIGFTGYSICELGYGEEYRLKGCVLNGIVYGDTTLTSVRQIGNSVPEEYTLSQNFPNPFNPKTNLEFGISKAGLVSLKVYNDLGKEIATLVNESKSAGIYSVVFDGSNLSSGVYYYILESGDFNETKRMVLLK